MLRVITHTTIAGAALILMLAVVAVGQSGDVTAGERLFKSEGCYGCHLVGRFGTPIGPDLSHVGAKYPKAYLERWLSDPAEQRPTAHMPKLELDRSQVTALAAYLASLQ